MLHAQHIDHVGLVDGIKRAGGVAPQRLDLPGDQRGRPAHRDPGGHPLKGEDVRAGYARVHHVPNDPDIRSVQGPQPAAQGEHVEQRLRGVLVLAIAGVDHRCGRPSGDQLGGAGVRGADHDRGGVVRRERLHGVLERLSLVDARSRRADRDHVRGEALGCQLE